MTDEKFAEKLLGIMDKKFDEILRPIQKEFKDVPTEKNDMNRIFQSMNDTLDKIDNNIIEICSTCDRIIEIAKKLEQPKGPH